MTDNQTNEAYSRGRIEGKLEALASVQQNHDARLDHHERRLAMQEKITWMLLGAIALIQLLPFLQSLVAHT